MGKIYLNSIEYAGGGGTGVDVEQTTGTSTTAVMSQKATTDALATKQASGDYATNTALNTGLASKADASTTYTKTEVNGLISAAIADVSALIGGASS